MNELHSLLKRQLRRHNGGAGPTTDGESDFLQAINDAYWQFDADRRMLEHSLDLTSRELLERNADLSRINTELEQRVEERTASLQSTLNFMYSLFQVTQSVIAFEDLQDVLKSIVTSAADTLSADRSVVITFDHEEKRVVHLVGAGEGVDNIIASVTYHELMEGLSGWVVREGRPAISPKGELDPRESAAAQKRRQETNCGCIAVLPLSYMGEILGTMTVINRPEQPDFTPQEVAWMEAIAIQTSTAIGRAQTYDQLKKANAFMEKQSERLQQELTDRELAESALAVERDLLQALMDNIPDTIYSKDAASRFTRINPAQAKVLGVASPEEAIGKSDFDFQPTELSRGFYEEEQRIIETGMPLINRIEFNPTMDGRPRWFSATKVPVRNSDGNVTGIVGVSRDITLVRQAEDALREAETKYRTLVENMPAIVYIDLADEPHNTIYINPQVQDMLGYSSEDWIAKPDLCNDIVHPEDSERMWKEAQESQTRGRYAGDYRYIAKDGRVVWVHDEAFLLKSDGEAPSVWQGVMLDITAQKAAEEALRQSEEKFRSLVERLPAITYISAFDEAKTRLYVSPQNEKYLGFSPAEWLADPELWRNQLHPDDHKRVLAEASHFYETGEPFISEYRTLSRDGRFVWFHDEAVIIRDADGKPQYIQGVKVNITEQKQAEEALRQSEERYRLMSWATRDAVWDWDLRAEQIWWGAGLQKIFRYPSESLQTDPEWRRDRIHENDKTKVDHTIQQALEGGMEFWSKEYRFQRIDGTYADIMDRAYILRDDSGQPYRMLGAMMDITERKQIEEIIRNQNDMLSSLYQITLELLKHRDIDALLNALVELSAKFLDAAFAEIMLIEGEELVVKAALKNQPALIGRRMNRDDAVLSWEAFDTRQPVVMKDYYNWPLRGAAYDEHILHAVIGYPILNEDECLGVLGLGRDKPGYEFTVDQIQFGRLLANLTALVLNNAQLREALREQSIHDPLTGLFNRRYMEEVLKQHLNRVTRQHHPLGMIMVDIDHFKRFNDAHGHAAGDALLREVGRLLQNQIRVEDIACRYGGEEFLLIMPGASIAETWDRAGQLRREVKELQIEHEGRMIGEITLSAGVAVYPEHGSTQDSLMRAADAALYRAKQGGRDQAFLAESRS